MSYIYVQKSDWSEGALAALVTEWPDCRQSAATIAKKINEQFGTTFTRNAIIGRAHRLGLQKNGKPLTGAERETVVRAARSRIVAVKTKVGAPTICDIEIPFEQRRTVQTLKHNDCRWPVGDPKEADFFFCGSPKLIGHSYCPGHCARAYR